MIDKLRVSKEHTYMQLIFFVDGENSVFLRGVLYLCTLKGIVVCGK
jgi:hypothetical protein